MTVKVQYTIILLFGGICLILADNLRYVTNYYHYDFVNLILFCQNYLHPIEKVCRP